MISQSLRKSKYKEEELKIPPLPEYARVRAWKNTVFQNINTASGRPDDKALAWAMTADDEGVTEDQLMVIPNKFRQLSRKITGKLQNMATGELGRFITQIVEDWLKTKRTAPGLLLLRIILTHYATGRAPDAL